MMKSLRTRLILFRSRNIAKFAVFVFTAERTVSKSKISIRSINATEEEVNPSDATVSFYEKYDGLEVYASAEDPKLKPVLCAPSQQEIESHNVNHLPFTSWCKHCVRGKSKSSPHPSSSSSEERQKPVISFDYAFCGVKDEEDAEKSGRTAFFIMHDSENKAVYAYVTERKGVDERLCKRVVADLERLG